MPQTIPITDMASGVARALAAGPLLGNAISGAMLALGVALMLVILLRRSGRYVQKFKRRAKKANQSAKPTPRDSAMANMFDRASPLLDAPATVVRWQVEMEELARELKAEIDTKMRLLQVLIRHSNEAAERLEAAADRAQRLGCVERSPAADDTLESRAATATANRPPVTPIPPYSEQVYAMADSGDTVAEIANHIGLPVGDIEFVLSLRSPLAE